MLFPFYRFQTLIWVVDCSFYMVKLIYHFFTSCLKQKGVYTCSIGEGNYLEKNVAFLEKIKRNLHASR